MGNEEETEHHSTSVISVYNWAILNDESDELPTVQGQFYNQEKNSDHHHIRFFANDEMIYFKDQNSIKHLSFFMTIMEEKFYYDNSEHIFALKLTSHQTETVLQTTDRETFIRFYCHLAKYCILTHFERHFEVKEELGNGSYGTVYRGLNKLSNQQVALKVFNKRNIHKSHSIKKVIQNEIYILEKLRKHHLSPLLEIFDTDDCIVLVLQLAKCGDLLNYLTSQDQQINETMMKHALEQILENLQALHRAGFIHRDIKPQNVVVKKGSQNISLFLCDFSISVKVDDEKCEFMKSLKAGTHGYAAPEVLQSNIFDEKCDIFSFGCLVYLLFSGKKLFKNIPDNEIVILVQDNQFIEQKISSIHAPKALKNLLRKLLQVDPSLRLSAQDALKEQYFSQNQKQVPCMIECDLTFKEFIQKRISLYSASTKGETFL